ncbi:MAG: energy-coupling factor ABC transporter ATP-binding protein [bacterium]|nr:energy-coupling factor ABC transporter ATP-binding protein [bacterium]
MDEVVKVSCVKHIYPDKTVVHLCGLDFVVWRGDRVAVLGPTGSGKTTLLKHILGLLEPSEGEVKVFGFNPIGDFLKIREKIGFVMQNVDDQLVAPTVFDEIGFAPHNFGYAHKEVEKMVDGVLKRLGIENLKNKIPHYLSGGEKRKVALASALVLEPELLVLDEPFEGLDPKSRNEYIRILNRLNEERGLTMIFTLHDVDIVPRIADFVYLLKSGGEISKKGTPNEIFQNFLELAKFNLEPPILWQIFEEFKKENPKLKIPTTSEEAIELIKELKL